MKYQMKKQIIDDVYLILTTPLSYETKFNAVKQLLLWGWTELKGKYIGCTYWSEGALEKYKDRYREADRGGNGLIHEHIISRGILMEEIFNLSEKELTKEKLEEYFEKYVLATVVTKEEE